MEGSKAYHPSHPGHQLVLRNFNKPYNCDGCKEQGFGTRYRCESSKCDYALHDSCVFNPPTATHHFYPDCTFKFYSQPRSRTIWCDACGKTVKGFGYHCAPKILDLHPCCVDLEAEKMLRISKCDVNFELNVKLTSECHWCESNNVNSGGYIKSGVGWSYKSRCNEYHYHVDCVREMTRESWKSRDETTSTSDSTSKNYPPLPPRPRTKRGQKYMKILKAIYTDGKSVKILQAVYSVVLSILMGDPTLLSASVLNVTMILLWKVLKGILIFINSN